MIIQHKPTNEHEDGGTPAELTLVYEKDDYTYTLRGTVVDPELKVWMDSEWDSTPRSQYYLTFKPDADGKQLKLSKKEKSGMKISRRAEVRLPALTVEEINKARKAVGCPESAALIVRSSYPEYANPPVPLTQTVVTFVWEDE